jgi:hypothetical protein
MYTVSIPARFTSPLLGYLAAPVERMAFLLGKPAAGTRVAGSATSGIWIAQDAIYLSDGADYTYQGVDGMELADGIRQRVLQAATRAGAALIEIHSHGAPPWPAAFSRTDLMGLQAVAPHMLWRLPGRPYTAIVVQDQGADALIWTAKDTPPAVPDTLIFGETALRPTGLSAERLARGVA